MATMVSTAVLKAVPLFASFPEDQLRMLTTVVTRRSLPRSTTVMASGDPTDSLYIVLSGRLKVMMSDAEGKEVILSILTAGEFFGEMGLIDDAPRSASVVSIEACELLSIAKRDFKKCMAENFEMTQAVIHELIHRLREADRRSAAWRCSTSTAEWRGCCSTWPRTSTARRSSPSACPSRTSPR